MLLVCSQDWICNLQMIFSFEASNNTGILITCTRLWLTESEPATPVDSIKDVVRSSVKVPEFNKHLKKARGHIGRNVVELTIKMMTIIRKPFNILIKLLNFHKFSYFTTTTYIIWAPQMVRGSVSYTRQPSRVSLSWVSTSIRPCGTSKQKADKLLLLLLLLFFCYINSGEKRSC